MADALSLRADLRRIQGDLSGALEDVDRALDLAPQSAAAWMIRGWVHWQRGEQAEARADGQRAFELDPHLASVQALRRFLEQQPAR